MGDLFSQDFLGKGDMIQCLKLLKEWEMFGISDMEKEVFSVRLQETTGVLC